MSRGLVSRHKKTGQYMKYVEPIRNIDRENKKRINNELQQIFNKIDSDILLTDYNRNNIYRNKYPNYRVNDLNITKTFDNIKKLKKELISLNKRIIFDADEIKCMEQYDYIKEYLKNQVHPNKLSGVYGCNIRHYNQLNAYTAVDKTNIIEIKKIILI